VPTYQYTCSECGQGLEVVQKFTDDPLTECPNCHGRLRKVFSPVGVVFKGSGFYRTDSRTGSNGSKSSSSNGAKSETKSDSSSSESSSTSSSSTSKDSSSSSSTSTTKTESAA
jgi:putative FmdB family regulatory protein